MTSEIDVSKTNEFLRRRKLRLQQVREQSKEIAKKIRQRAKVEKLRHVINLDAKKEKDYFELQEKLVGRLEQLYSHSLQNVGSGHRNAVEAVVQEDENKKDLSKLRGKEAVAELRKRKQAKLDEQKKILDRKLQAREAANELSREKSAIVSKIINSKSTDNIEKNIIEPITENNNIAVGQKEIADTDKDKHDMGTQWEGDELPNEWGSTIPRLSLPKDDRDSLKDKSDQRKLNLFALSDEMPSSLRGGSSSVPTYPPQQKSSVTLISEYLQTRNLRLRQTEPVSIKKSDDLQSLKQTILRSRASKTDGNLSNVCHVLDKKLIPVPSWKAEDDPFPCCHCQRHIPFSSIQPVTNVIINKNPFQRSYVSSQSMMKGSVHRKSKIYNTPVSDKSDNSKAAPDSTLNVKNSITTYNHSTRDIKNVVYDNERFVIRECDKADDAYANALKETSMINEVENRELEKKKVDMRNKVAMTREKVDKEYKDTLAFLNTLSKEKTNKPYNTPFMDHDRQQVQGERHQKKLQEEFKKIERECSKRTCKHKNRSTSLNKSRSKSRSPDNFNAPPRNFQYDWMPVPDSDKNFAVHTIPNKNQKSNNSVKFNDVDTYHEYRSRHKHTPPTKDVPKNREKKRVVETLVIEQSTSETTDESSVTSEASSLENLNVAKNKTNKDFLNDPRLSDGDRIVIYKILDSKKDKKHKRDKTTKIINKSFKSTSMTDNDNKSAEKQIEVHENTRNSESVTVQHGIAFENLNEGVYKAGKNGDNIASMYFSENNQDENREPERHDACKKTVTHQNAPEDRQQTREDVPTFRCEHFCSGCKCSKRIPQPTTSAATSTSSFQTATNDKINNLMADGGIIKLIDEGGPDTGKFYIGASGFLKDENYEVVIQLKKKEIEKVDDKTKEIFVNTEENIPSPTKNLSNVQTGTQSSLGIDLKESAAQTTLNQEVTNESTQDPVQPIQEPSGTNTLLKKDIASKSGDLDNKTKTFVDKNVYTTFQDSFAIPDEVSKADPIVRPATSTYTQTSFSSPNSRPVFMHMTSSTSTAYMSPPEMILPKFLRQNRVLCTDDDLLSNHDIQDNGEKYTSKKCKCMRKSVSNGQVRKCNHICSTTDTPPNTARSYEYNGSISENVETEKVKHRHSSKMCRKNHKHKSNFTLHRRSSKSTHDTNSTALFSNKSVHRTLNPPKSVGNKKAFNPVVKQYVNKLLALNKEGLKAIQVISQDCSSVDTPRSSIINAPFNVNKKGATLENKISLEQIKIMLEQQIVEDYAKRALHLKQTEKQNKSMSKIPRRRYVHKVKSLNISKNLFKNKNINSNNSHSQMDIKSLSKPQLSSSSTNYAPLPKQMRKEGSEMSLSNRKSRSKSSPTPRTPIVDDERNDLESVKSSIRTPIQKQQLSQNSSSGTRRTEYGYDLRPHCTTSVSTDSDRRHKRNRSHSQILPTDISTQTSGIDSDINFMKLAENKLQNMEKIADLTEKCTKRLSNLAKVLDEVRRNKSLVYSQISTSESTSDSEPKQRKITEDNPHLCENDETPERNQNQQPIFDFPFQENIQKDSTFMPILRDIPKPLTPSTLSLSTISEKSNVATSVSSMEQVKNKAKPPPALSRINLRNLQDNNYVIPHELSTVMEVDSPMSLKLKNQSSHRDMYPSVHNLNHISDGGKPCEENETQQDRQIDVGLHIGKPHSGPELRCKASSCSSDDGKLEMMDMKLFNDIMLKPFLSLQEYAKQCDVRIDDAANVEDALKDEQVCDELSSLHSEASLPDVISELLKRNLISEPFKFDTGSHVTTSMSSESSLSLIALSKMYKGKRRSHKQVVNKENMAETSETLSISSNPDLENAFQKLGMGWASSTLKKTKERLALSSSSNTSSSSYSQLKFKSFNKDLPSIPTDSTLSEQNYSNKKSQSKNDDSAKNALQQTSLTNSMTVKEFLTNELAKKITFTNKSNRNDDNEFVSLYETKMHEEIQNTPEKVTEGEQSAASQANNRARTSTPVQIFKSTTYHTTSSSNTSNGLFSNADELSSVKVTSTSIRNHSTSDKDDLTIPNCSLKRKGLSDKSKSD